MRRLVLLALLVVVATAASPPPAAAADGHCCVAAGLEASYDASAHRISARWGTPRAAALALEIRAADRLDADGVADASSARSVRARLAPGATAFDLGTSKLAVVLASHASVFVQVRFGCPARTEGPPCSTRTFWSRPVQVTADDEPPGKRETKPPVESSWQRVRITSNGTRACLDAFDRVRAAIAALNANTAAAKNAAAEGKSTARYVREQARLKRSFDAEYATAVTACAKKKP